MTAYDKAFFVAILLMVSTSFLLFRQSKRIQRHSESHSESHNSKVHSLYLVFLSLNLLYLWFNSDIVSYLVFQGVSAVVLACHTLVDGYKRVTNER